MATATGQPGQVDAALRAQSAAHGEDPPKQLIPLQYSSLETTTLNIDVPASGMKNADFNLKSE